jgi:hypothetical protein
MVGRTATRHGRAEKAPLHPSTSSPRAERGLIKVDTVPYAFSGIDRAHKDLRHGKVVGRAVLAFNE